MKSNLMLQVRRLIPSKVARLLRRAQQRLFPLNPYRNIATTEKYRWYLSSRTARSKAAINRLLKDQRRLLIMLSLVPIEDSGGGQRAAQLCRAAVDDSCSVLFISAFPCFEDVSNKFNLPQTFSRISLLSVDQVDVPAVVQALNDHMTEVTIIVEAPHPALVTLALQLHTGLPYSRLIYESIDPWNSSLGGDWYSPEIESRIEQAAHVRAATAIALKEVFEAKSLTSVLVPNAVNHHIFSYVDRAPVPNTVLYVGSLWGDWLDYTVFEVIARSLPSWDLTIVGNPSRHAVEIANRHPNISLLGLKPNIELPSIISNASVCIAPFLWTDVSRAVSPLKVFEYLAIGRPVVASGLPDVEHLPRVRVAHSAGVFPSLIVEEASKGVLTPSESAGILRDHSWTARWQTLNHALDKNSPRTPLEGLTGNGREAN